MQKSQWPEPSWFKVRFEVPNKTLTRKNEDELLQCLQRTLKSFTCITHDLRQSKQKVVLNIRPTGGSSSSSSSVDCLFRDSCGVSLFVQIRNRQKDCPSHRPIPEVASCTCAEGGRDEIDVIWRDFYGEWGNFYFLRIGFVLDSIRFSYYWRILNLSHCLDAAKCCAHRKVFTQTLVNSHCNLLFSLFEAFQIFSNPASSD